MGRIAAALQDLRALETLAARDTVLARRDPRAKLLVTLLFIVTVVSFGRYQIAALLPLALYPAALAAEGQVPARMLWRTMWLASPFALMVGLANPLFEREPMLALGGVVLSAGWVSFASIVVRIALTVSAAVVLLGGTGMHAVCAALGRLGAPMAFTVQLMFLHRYLFVLSDEALRLGTAFGLRAAPGRRLSLSLYASLCGQLLLRAFDRATRVHQAMLARGFDGNVCLTYRGCWQRSDGVFVGLWAAWFMLVRSIDLPQALGALLTGLPG
jgi:cobalt/nickel transport system permease protein